MRNLRHAYWQTPRERQVDGALLSDMRRTVCNQFRNGFINLMSAREALRQAGMFESEIREVLS